MKSSIIILIFIIIFSNQIYSNPLQKEQNLSPEYTQTIKSITPIVIINANVKKCSVYINGEYRGQTPITETNLVAGTYHLKIEKQGYDTYHTTINISSFQKSSYYINLKKD